MNRRLRVRIRLRRWPGLGTLLLMYLLLVVALACLAWAGTAPAASAAQPRLVDSGLRSFYLTPLQYDGAHARRACASGYHMASLWELVDPSILRYDTLLGLTRDDSGQGPPSTGGWVRTGGPRRGIGGAGEVNCEGWTTASASLMGTTIHLPVIWDIGDQDLGPWGVGTGLCSGWTYVWCVSDVGPYYVYLPLVQDGHS
jgi:hypothetical protein